LKRYGSLTVSA